MTGPNAKRPTSLLYTKGANDSMELIGVMYTAAKRASNSDLDKRIPLSIAQWHLHVNLCTPERGEQHRWTELQNGKPRFGPLSEIATEKECKAVKGKFRPVLFNWMVHANVFSSSVWGESHAH